MDGRRAAQDGAGRAQGQGWGEWAGKVDCARRAAESGRERTFPQGADVGGRFALAVRGEGRVSRSRAGPSRAAAFRQPAPCAGFSPSNVAHTLRQR